MKSFFYICLASLFFGNALVADSYSTEFDKLAQSVSMRPKCKAIEPTVEALCANNKNGPCKFTSQEQVKEAVEILKSRPAMDPNYSKAFAVFQKITEPTDSNIGNALTLATQNCWPITHMRLWSGIAGADAKIFDSPLKEQIKVLIESHLVNDPTAPIAFIEVLIKVASLEKLAQSKAFPISKIGQSEISEHRKNMKLDSKKITTPWDDLDLASSEDSKKLSKKQVLAAFDLLKKESQIVSEWDKRIKNWYAKYYAK